MNTRDLRLPKMRESDLYRSLVMSTGEWLAAGALALVLAAAHFFAYRVSRLSTKTQDVLASVGGGVAIAYIFVHLMPELAVGGRDLTELDVARYTPTPVSYTHLTLPTKA